MPHRIGFHGKEIVAQVLKRNKTDLGIDQFLAGKRRISVVYQPIRTAVQHPTRACHTRPVVFDFAECLGMAQFLFGCYPEHLREHPARSGMDEFFGVARCFFGLWLYRRRHQKQALYFFGMVHGQATGHSTAVRFPQQDNGLIFSKFIQYGFEYLCLADNGKVPDVLLPSLQYLCVFLTPDHAGGFSFLHAQ